MELDRDFRRANINLAITIITDKIRVSTAAIYYSEWFGEYYQYETWIFSNDKMHQKNVMVIHGTHGGDLDENMVKKSKHIHERISNNLLKKFKDEQ